MLLATLANRRAETMRLGLVGHSACVRWEAMSFVTHADADLIRACRKNKADQARQLLCDGAKPNCRDLVSRTPLYFAAYRGNADLVKDLLRRGALPNDADMVCVVQGASVRAHVAVLMIDVTYQDGYTPLHWACAKNHVLCAEALLDEGADVNARTIQVGARASTRNVKCPRVAIDSQRGFAFDCRVGSSWEIRLCTGQSGRTRRMLCDCCCHEAPTSMPSTRCVVYSTGPRTGSSYGSRSAHGLGSQMGQSLLHGAASVGRKDSIAKLLARGAEIDTTDNVGADERKASLCHLIMLCHVCGCRAASHPCTWLSIWVTLTLHASYSTAALT